MTFQSRPLLDIRPDHTALDHGQLDDFKLSEAAAGSGTPWKQTTRLKRKVTLPFLFGSKVEWRAFRDFLAARAGQQDGFWLPLWVMDYPLLALVPVAVHVSPVGLAELYAAGLAAADDSFLQFSFLALNDARLLEPHPITSIQPTLGVGGSNQLTLDTIIEGDFDVATASCCALIYARLATGPVSYQYIADGVIRCDVEFIELPREYAGALVTTTPLFLYEFTRGDFVWRATNWPEPLVLDEECWSPDNIRHGSLHSGIDFLPEDLTLTVATDMADHPLRYYLSRSAFEVTGLQIWEADATTLEFDRDTPLYKGRLGNVEFRENGVIEARCSSLLRVAEQQLSRMQCQRTCNHRLYDPNCGVSPQAYEVAGALVDVADDYIEAAEFAAEATARADADWFALGKVSIGTERRMIVGQAAGKLYLDEPFIAAAIGDVATAWPGCNKRVSHCVGRFDNILNAAMFAYVPNSNPAFEALKNPAPEGGK